jgi:hypothetical protein
MRPKASEEAVLNGRRAAATLTLGPKTMQRDGLLFLEGDAVIPVNGVALEHCNFSLFTQC